MSDKNTRTRTLLPALPPDTRSAVGSGVFALAAVALVAFGIGMIFVPAGVIAAGAGCVALQWQFFGGA